ncbi:hypothetical protein BV20DRAFT_541284 [Pilatotrama ljubarskyi]|nr:hypothetical protein BV20DRAFT_541284 [Pilatotrama ljubarskyi]
MQREAFAVSLDLSRVLGPSGTQPLPYSVQVAARVPRNPHLFPPCRTAGSARRRLGGKRVLRHQALEDSACCEYGAFTPFTTLPCSSCRPAPPYEADDTHAFVRIVRKAGSRVVVTPCPFTGAFVRHGGLRRSSRDPSGTALEQRPRRMWASMYRVSCNNERRDIRARRDVVTLAHCNGHCRRPSAPSRLQSIRSDAAAA